MPRIIALLLCCLLGLGARAEDGPAPYRLSILLDARADQDARDQALQRLRAWADDGDPFSRYLLGTLYRLGRDHPARLLERDRGRASGLLGHAALAGSLEAMAGLAELELDSGNPLAGMMWAQAHINFSAHAQGDDTWRHRPYEAGLVLRLSDALAAGPDAVSQSEIAETYRGFVADYGERILRGIDRWPGAPGVEEFRQAQLPLTREASGGGPMGGQNLSWRLRKRPDEPASVLFLMGIDAKGRVDRLEVIDTRPGADDWKGLARSARQARFNEIEEGAPLRWILAPYSFDDGSARLRREG